MFEKNLKYYRLRKGMNMKELAKACGLTPMAVSNYESGKRRPDMETIKKLAKVLDIHVADFLSARNASLVFDHREFRKHSVLSKAQQDYVRESVEEYFNRFFHAVECLGGNPLPDPPLCGSIERSASFEENAQKLRAALELQKDGPVDEIVGILENKGILVFEMEIDNDHFSGMNGFVDEYPYIVINENMNAERKRTTILHELSHLMFNWEEGNEAENEKEATAIAGAFLITEKDLRRELGLRRSSITKDMVLVCEEYGISMYLLVKRASQVGIISESVEKDFYIWANKVGWRKNEPARVRKDEKPLLFKQLVFRAVNEEGVNLQRGAELLRIPVSEMKAFCGSMEV